MFFSVLAFRPAHNSDNAKGLLPFSGVTNFLMLFSLQQGTKKAAVKILKNFDEAITVDIASLDPEQLYQRPYAG